jgi:hypothetical protein
MSVPHWATAQLTPKFTPASVESPLTVAVNVKGDCPCSICAACGVTASIETFDVGVIIVELPPPQLLIPTAASRITATANMRVRIIFLRKIRY